MSDTENVIPETAVEAAMIAFAEAPYEPPTSVVQKNLNDRAQMKAALEAAAPHMKPAVTDEAFGYAVSAIRGHGEFTTAEAEAAVQDIIDALGVTK